MNVRDLAPSELAARLKQPGIYIQTGAFVTHVHSAIPSVAAGISLLYADFALVEHAEFADFRVSLTQPRNLRRWFKRQVLFMLDGHAPFKPLPLDQAFPMLEWGLNWCVSANANSYLMIHAAVIEKHGYAAVLPAPPGSGKSTLCAALVQRGWRLLSDEMALIRLHDGRVLPLPRPVSLKNASIDIIQRYAPAATFSPKIHDTMKGTVAHMQAPRDSVMRAAELAPVAWVIFPRYQAQAEAQLSQLSRARAFMRIADNAFNYSLLGQPGFTAMADMIDSAHCYDFSYSSLDDAIATFDALAAPEHAA